MDDAHALKNDPKLRSYKDSGGPGSPSGPRAVAVRMQDKTGKKYLEFHRSCSAAAGPTRHALAVARTSVSTWAGSTRTQAEVKATLEESFKLAEALGLNGTPSYVIGDDVVIGAVGIDALKEKVKTSRCGKPSC